MTRLGIPAPGGGIARGFSHLHSRYFRGRGWQPDYPGTTGYIIPTLFAAADRCGRGDLAERALLAARWECDIQRPNGAVQGGVVSAIDGDGIWRRAHSRFAIRSAALYNARTAWALLECAHRLRMPEAREAAARALRSVTHRQFASGWFPECCLSQPDQPLLHTIAYTIRGPVEGGRLLGDDRIIATAVTAAALTEQVDPDRRLAGRYATDRHGAAAWRCLTVSAEPGIRGGINGSDPVDGGYAPHETLSWATKFFADALMRHERVPAQMRTPVSDALLLA